MWPEVTSRLAVECSLGTESRGRVPPDGGEPAWHTSDTCRQIVDSPRATGPAPMLASAWSNSGSNSRSRCPYVLELWRPAADHVREPLATRCEFHRIPCDPLPRQEAPESRRSGTFVVLGHDLLAFSGRARCGPWARTGIPGRSRRHSNPCHRRTVFMRPGWWAAGQGPCNASWQA